MERSQWESSPPSVWVAFGGQRVMSDHWNFLVRAWCLSPSFPDNPFLNVSSPHAHTDTVAYRPARTLSSEYTLRHMHALPSSSVAWSWSKVPKSAASMLGRWERTSWKQWNGLISGFASGFDKSPCSEPKFLWPLVKNFLSPRVRPFHPRSFCEYGRSGLPEVLCL